MKETKETGQNFRPWQVRGKVVRVYVYDNSNIFVDDGVKAAGVIGKWVSNRISCCELSWSLTVWCFQIFPGKDPLSTCSSHLATCWEITEKTINYRQELLLYCQNKSDSVLGVLKYFLWVEFISTPYIITLIQSSTSETDISLHLCCLFPT